MNTPVSGLDWAIIALYLLLYPAARFVVEFYRYHDQVNPFNGPLDTSQWISLLLIAMGALLLFRRQPSPAR